MIYIERYHDISCGHRVVGHESKCALLHGHNYRIHFTCAANRLDPVGRVIDFSVVKARLCLWLEERWDHRFLAYERDDMVRRLADADPSRLLSESIVWVPFNPTAEKMAEHLLYTIGPAQLAGTEVVLITVRVEETRKCSAVATSPFPD